MSFPGITADWNAWRRRDLKQEAIIHTGRDGLIARAGEIAVGTTTRFRRFSAPVAGKDQNGKETIAFLANLTGSAARNAGVWTWSSDAPGELRLLGRKSDPSTSGSGKFDKFESLAILPNYGPVVVASLKRGGNGVDATNCRGIWAWRSSGVLQEVLRTGSSVRVGTEDRVLKSFFCLGSAAGSPAQRRAFGAVPNALIYLATFTDRTRGIVRVTLP